MKEGMRNGEGAEQVLHSPEQYLPFALNAQKKEQECSNRACTDVVFLKNTFVPGFSRCRSSPPGSVCPGCPKTFGTENHPTSSFVVSFSLRTKTNR
jgi:hypothetical protein